MRRVSALVLLLAALALTACGGENDSENAANSSTTPAAPTGASGTAKKNSAGTDNTKSNAKDNANSRAKNKTGNKNKSKSKSNAGTRNGTGKTKSRSGTRQQQQKVSPNNAKDAPANGAPPKSGKLPATDEKTYSVAKMVCGGYIAETLKGNKLTDLAKSYAHAWPADRRDAAYDGCLVGLKQPRPPGSEEDGY